MIIIDNREPHYMDNYFQSITEFPTVRLSITEQTKYPTGDYIYKSDNLEVMIERKTVSDFDRSFTTNHMWEQCQKMRLWMNEKPETRFARIYLIGRLGEYNPHGKVDMVQRISTIEAIATRYNIMVIPLDDDGQLVVAMNKMIKSHEEGKLGIGREFKFTKAKEHTLLEHTLGGIEKIGPDKVSKIIDKIGLGASLIDFTNELLNDDTYIQDIHGIGPKTEEKIKQELGIIG